ncbi:hypothetical protein [Pseudomonas sp. GL-R-19]|uniref:hypothetical protein n=1 Tax=Pseudomonas sp. GL-R-19 TaxID=2832391 RepID=UPI001CBC2673|nr:hypothetical protein [Pseudomonas sp. GL-R-19]
MSKQTINSSNSWLSRFEIGLASSSSQLYPNARQQLLVTLSVDSRTGQTISEEELESLRITTRKNDLFPLLPGSDDGGEWFYNERKNLYHPYPATASHPPPDQERSGEIDFFQKDFYVMSRAPAGTSVRLYAQITRQTTDGPVTYNTAIDPTFKSYVDIRTAEIPRFNIPENYSFNRDLVAGNPNGDLFTWEYQLAGKNVQMPVVELLSVSSMDPAGMIQWVDRDDRVTRASHVGYAAPGESDFNYNTAIVLGQEFSPTAKVARPRAGHVIVVLQGGNNIPYHSQSAINQGGPCRMHAIDMYGNEHVLNIAFKDLTPAGRLELVLF